MPTDPIAWIQENLTPSTVPSTAFIYDAMSSQSGRSLPIIYQPFDPANRDHWADRGAMYDFSLSLADAEGGAALRLLDFGPGDGWPSLIVAPRVGHVIGVDASQRRVEACAENANRMGIGNATFVHVPPDEPLPFPDNHFDGIMAASSIEQTPDPLATLTELYRVLRPGGRLRLAYEALTAYADGRERDTWLCSMNERQAQLVLYDRNLAGERAIQYGLVFDLDAETLRQQLGATCGTISYDQLDADRLAQLAPHLIKAKQCTTRHPSGATWARMLSQIGFQPLDRGGFGRHNGSHVAAERYKQTPPSARPRKAATIDALLQPWVAMAVQLAAPLSIDPWLTAFKGG